jgi:hypothetical protein
MANVINGLKMKKMVLYELRERVRDAYDQLHGCVWFKTCLQNCHSDRPDSAFIIFHEKPWPQDPVIRSCLKKHRGPLP